MRLIKTPQLKRPSSAFLCVGMGSILLLGANASRESILAVGWVGNMVVLRSSTVCMAGCS